MMAKRDLALTLADAQPDTYDDLLADETGLLGETELRTLQQRTFALVTERYLQSPSFWRRMEGRVRWARLEAAFDDAFDRLPRRLIAAHEQAQQILVDGALAAAEDAVYLRRRAAVRIRQDDYLDYVRRHGTAANVEHQSQLELNDQLSRNAITLERVKAELERMNLGVTQPFELQKQLSSMILAAWEKQERDPSAKATFGNLEEIITRASTATTNLTRDLDADGNPLDDETRKRAAAEALDLVMKLADRLISRL